MSVIIEFFEKLGPDILQRTLEHVYLTLVAMAIATAIAVPLGVLLAHSRWKKVSGAVMGLVAVIQTIPGLALVALIAILFTLIHLPLIGEPPALVALVLYALLPILRNTYTSIRQVDPTMIEVATGLGMRRHQILFSVELPVSLPVIMAGIRIATVWTIGVATLCTFIGAGGLGVLIMRGLRSIQMDYLIAGTVPAALLAVVFDLLLAFAERWLTPDGPWNRISLRKRFVAAAICAAILGIAIVGLHLVMSGRPAAASDGAGSVRGVALRAAFDAEFFTRPDGYPAVCRHYGFSFPEEPQQMDAGLMYKAAAEGRVDIIDAWATDGRIAAFDLVVLEDDEDFFPPYYAAPLVRRDTLEQYPELRTVLGMLAGRFSDTTMQQLNYQADEQGKKASTIARNFLLQNGLIPADAAPDSESRGSITIGGKPFTEQEILGEIMAGLIECRTRLRVNRKLNLGGTMLSFDALRSGDIDLYPEYTGTGLVHILKREVIADPDKSYQVVKEAFAAEYDLVWLEPFGFNNTYTLTMRRKLAEHLGIQTISDLARYLRAE
jgi:osmoprotectant transport system permease protein